MKKWHAVVVLCLFLLGFLGGHRTVAQSEPQTGESATETAPASVATTEVLSPDFRKLAWKALDAIGRISSIVSAESADETTPALFRC